MRDVTGAAPPSAPAEAATIDDLTGRLRSLRAWAGQPSYADIADRIRAHRASQGVPPGAQRVSRATVYDCFRSGRSRLDVDLLIEVVHALGVPRDEAFAWRRAYGSVVGRDESIRLVEVRSAIPAPESYFSGRNEVLAELLAAPPGTTSALVGMAGAGKSQIAFRAAEQLKRTHDAAQVFVGLGGGDKRHAPPSSESVLSALLQFIGASDQTLRYLSTDDRSEIWAAWIHERNAVVVFDDAFDEAQLEHVLPPDHGGRIIVTSRRNLDGLKSDAITVEPLALDEAVDLLQRMAGDRIVEHHDAAVRIAQLCGLLPLELAVAGAHVAERNTWTLDDHVRRLEQLPRGTTLRPVLAAMTGDLDPAAQVMFRRLALHPGTRIAPWAAAALADFPVDTAATLLDRLAADHLIRRVGGDGDAATFELHDLVRDHAAEVLRDVDAHSNQREAIHRLANRAIPRARVAVGVASPNTAFSAPVPADAETVDPPEVANTDDALAQLAAERTTLVDLVDLALAFDLAEHSAALACTLAPYLLLLGDTGLAQKTLERGLAAPNPAVRAAIHRDLALVSSNQGLFDSAIEHLRIAGDTAPDPTPGRTHGLLAGVYSGRGQFAEALEHYRISRDEAEQAGNLARRARATSNMGNTLRLLNDYDGAESALLEALAASDEADDVLAVIHEMSTLGLVYEDSGRLDDALDFLSRANDRAASIGSGYLRDQNLARMASIHRRRGDRATAFELIEQAIAVARDVEDLNAEAEARVVLGEILVDDGRATEAIVELQTALDIASRLGAAVATTGAHEALGEASLAVGDVDAATEHFRAALELTTSTNDRLEQGRSHRGLGEAVSRLGNDDEAAEHFAAALVLLDELCPPEAAALRDRLAG